MASSSASHRITSEDAASACSFQTPHNGDGIKQLSPEPEVIQTLRQLCPKLSVRKQAGTDGRDSGDG